MSKGKGKQQAGPASPTAVLPLMPNPSSGSSSPSSSLARLWSYLLPALNHIFRSPTNTPERAPAIDISYHMGIHTATYNYFTSPPDTPPPITTAIADGGGGGGARQTTTGMDLYLQLDRYFTDLVRELLLGAPEDDRMLIRYLIPCFKRYATGARAVNRLLNYVNRHYVKRAVDEDRGWLMLSDILDAVVTSTQKGESREQTAKNLDEERRRELKNWGYEDGGSNAQLTQAELRAEAASSLDRVVSLEALALRRFRMEFIEPLLVASKVKRKKSPAAIRVKINCPEGRLARAARELLGALAIEAEERRNLVQGLAETLGSVGVHSTHPVRKMLHKSLTKLPPR